MYIIHHRYDIQKQTIYHFVNSKKIKNWYDEMSSVIECIFVCGYSVWVNMCGCHYFSHAVKAHSYIIWLSWNKQYCSVVNTNHNLFIDWLKLAQFPVALTSCIPRTI